MREGELDGKKRRYLRALAHDKKPVVQIGSQGSTDGVIKAIDQALVTHELIKVRVAKDEDVDLDALATDVAQKAHAQLVQVIGHTLVLFRRRKTKPVIVLPGERPPQQKKATNLPRTASPAKKKKRAAKSRARKRTPTSRDEEE